jgi:hypothetical protein
MRPGSTKSERWMARCERAKVRLPTVAAGEPPLLLDEREGVDDLRTA